MNEGNVENQIDPLKRHRAQAAWQIWIPLGLGIAVVVALCVLSALATFSDLPISKTLAPVAVIWVVIPNCFSGLITLAILFGCVFLAAKMVGGLPQTGAKILGAVNKVQSLVQAFANRIAAPVIAASSFQAKVAHFWNSIWSGKSRGEGA
jgi:hypothetical protein